MELPDPEQCIRDQEISDFILAVVKYLRPPVRMLTESLVRVLIESCAVKLGENVRISWKMSGNPVENDTNVILMQ